MCSNNLLSRSNNILDDREMADEEKESFWVDSAPLIITAICQCVIYYSNYALSIYIAFCDVRLDNCYIEYILLAILLYVLLKFIGVVTVRRDTALISLTIPFIIFVNVRAVKIPVLEFLFVFIIIFFNIFCSVGKIVRLKKIYRDRGWCFSKKITKRIYIGCVGKILYASSFIISIYLYACLLASDFFANVPEQMNALVMFPRYMLIETDNFKLKDETINIEGKSRDELLKEYMEKLIVLSDKHYNKSSVKKKMEALQEVCNIECAYLDCNRVPEVISDDRETTNNGILTLGLYNRKNDEIWIIPDSLYDDKSCAALVILLHEIRHAYQHECVEGSVSGKFSRKTDSVRMDENVAKWAEEFSDKWHNKITENYDEYKNRHYERDADNYGYNTAKIYYRLINNYSSGGM